MWEAAALVGGCGRDCDGDGRNRGNGDRPTTRAVPRVLQALYII